MGIRRMNYLDIPKDLRDQKVREVQAGLRHLLADPTVSKEQRLAARTRSESLQRWADGELAVKEPVGIAEGVSAPEPEEDPQEAPAPESGPPAPPEHHEVEVTEALGASEGPPSETEPESAGPESESTEVDVEPDSAEDAEEDEEPEDEEHEEEEGS